MDSSEYHAIEWDKEEDTMYGTCKFCGLSFGDHETTCPYGEPSGYDVDPDPVARGREEDRTYGRG